MNQESGWVIIDKPSGPTSRKIVNQVSRALKIRKVGHAGTLDPFAEGVLILAWNKATPLVPFFQDLPKTYEVEAEFGRATDTQDRTGTTTETFPWQHLSLDQVEEAMKPLRGVIQQVPPMYSALRHEGTRLYDLAR
ncbi:MAG: pseudouridine synthase, partial [Candidatus Eisenbacteria bacterium]|nr:pseudouridine synthase [Candidatus Eisenbacteria bacterium]